MSKEIESIASALFDKIRSRFSNITLGDESAKDTSDPEKARFFNFTYSGQDGAEFGKITLSLVDEKSLKAYFGQNISADMDREQRKEWYGFLRNLRQFTKRHPTLKSFDVRDITKSNLKLQDVKQQAKTDDVSTSDDVTVTESRLYGTSRNSYADVAECRLLIKHDGLVSDDIHGDRSRKIREIFIETPRGERFLLDFKNLHGARAMCRHVNEGGAIYDEIGECIGQMVSEMNSMSHFVRAVKRRQFEDSETSDMAQAATKHYLQLKNTLRHLASKRYYDEFVEQYRPESPVEDEVDEDALRERFVKKIYDDRFNAALPIVYKAYKKYKSEAAGKLGDELAEWAEDVSESVWDDAPPEADINIDELKNKMSSPWKVGIDGIDAITDLKRIFPGKDLTDLNNSILHYTQDHGPDADAIELVKPWLGQEMPEVLDQINVGPNNGNDDKTNFVKPVSPQQAHPNDYGSISMDDPITDPNIPTAMREDSLDFIRQLAGLVK